MDFGIDPDFNHCIDGLVWVDVSRIKPHKRARHIGLPCRGRAGHIWRPLTGGCNRKRRPAPPSFTSWVMPPTRLRVCDPHGRDPAGAMTSRTRCLISLASGKSSSATLSHQQPRPPGCETPLAGGHQGHLAQFAVEGGEQLLGEPGGPQHPAAEGAVTGFDARFREGQMGICHGVTP